LERQLGDQALSHGKQDRRPAVGVGAGSGIETVGVVSGRLHHGQVYPAPVDFAVPYRRGI